MSCSRWFPTAADYYGFGTDEFLELCRQLGAAPMIVLAATSTDPAQLEYALEWVHYLVDPPTTDRGRRRAAYGHPAPYRVPYIQIDNEPMNHGLSPEGYAAIVNLYGPRLRAMQNGRLRNQRSRHRDALLLTAGQLARVGLESRSSGPVPPAVPGTTRLPPSVAMPESVLRSKLMRTTRSALRASARWVHDLASAQRTPRDRSARPGAFGPRPRDERHGEGLGAPRRLMNSSGIRRLK